MTGEGLEGSACAAAALTGSSAGKGVEWVSALRAGLSDGAGGAASCVSETMASTGRG